MRQRDRSGLPAAGDLGVGLKDRNLEPQICDGAFAIGGVVSREINRAGRRQGAERNGERLCAGPKRKGHKRSDHGFLPAR